MSMRINYNASAIIANNSLKLNDNLLTSALERLSSGYKINSAKDDAAGLAISRRMNAQIKGLGAAKQDAMDGTSVTEIADGALSEVHDILQRMNELSVKAANGVVTDEDREAIQSEIDMLAEEIDRIGQTTEYNGQKLFTGDYDLKGYTNNVDVKVDFYSDSVDYGNYDLNISAWTFDADGLLTSVNGDSNCLINMTKSNGTIEQFRVSGDKYHLDFKGDDGDKIILDVSALNGGTAPGALELELKGYGAMTFQVGANETQTIDIRFQKLSSESLKFKNQDSDPTKNMVLDLSTEEGARKANGLISDAIQTVSNMRSKIGAYANRLEHTESNLTISSDNLTAAFSRIMDTDMSEEMTNYSNLQIVSQAATAILAQANERPSQMLQLLQ